MNKIKLCRFALLVLTFLASPAVVFADTTAVLLPDSIQNGCSGTSNCTVSAINSANGTGATRSGGIGLHWRIASGNIPNGSVITSVTFTNLGRYVGGTEINPEFQSLNTTCATGSTQFQCSYAAYGSSYLSRSCSDTTSVSPTYTWNNNDCVLSASEGTGGTGGLDLVEVQFSFVPPAPQSSVTSVVASESAATINTTLEGDTSLLGVNNTCKIDVFYNKLSGDNDVPSGVLATILLNTRNTQTFTQYLGNRQYLGHSYSTSDSSWIASNVVLPYFAGVSADIRMSLQCINDDGDILLSSQSLSSLYPNWNPSLISTPSALSNGYGVVQPQCQATDIVCSFQSWLYRTLDAIFGVSALFDPLPFTQLKAKADTKAPFAYINTVLDLDLDPNASAASELIPVFSIGLTDPGNPYVSSEIPDSISWYDDDENGGPVVQGFAGTFRNIILVLLWFAFVWYIVFRIKHIF